jgi:phosphatidylinositol glycan class V
MQAWLNADQKRILRWSIARQLAILALMAATTCLIAPFDDSGTLLLAGSSRSSILAHIALPFTQWDTLHFLGIAKDGYATEQQFAFMPGVPLLLRFFGRGLASSRGFDAAAAVIGTSLLANILSVCLPVMLYR